LFTSNTTTTQTPYLAATKATYFAHYHDMMDLLSISHRENKVPRVASTSPNQETTLLPFVHKHLLCSFAFNLPMEPSTKIT